ncbi:probable ATP-dependent transporter ycf16 [Selaginella moellendorffii]|uniref:probable ATP-dependent transporter ycf16 n=1 Tax=Selaginella moellendorffii TaxID=88036 RepID=UPI000D1C3036|nr:probable ATP-dependent transporter ycf16 [Selaginella moellendorffii]|eukprot:XP_002988761.2 probable ATP-dependent transporter ycf16 [Selaginella moellendorffii]
MVMACSSSSCSSLAQPLAEFSRKSPSAKISQRSVIQMPIGMRRSGVSISLARGLNPGCALAMAVAQEELRDSADSSKAGAVLLEVRDLKARVADSETEILRGVDLTIREGEVHAIMGKNGSGKSTFAKVLVGHPDYEVTAGSAGFKNENLFDKEPEERSHAGLFMSFQSPIEVPGVSNDEFLRMACNARRAALNKPELPPLEFFAHLMPKLKALNMSPTFLNRNVNEGFSGGEKKRNEILQLAVLEADLALLDEIDSGLDVDALRDVANAINGLRTSKNAVLMITHHERLLDYIHPDYVHIMDNGRIVRTGDSSLAQIVHKEGYTAL